MTYPLLFLEGVTITNVFSSLMANFDTARAALDTSLNSSGSAIAEHAKWSESLEARLNKLKAAWQSLSQTFLNSDFLKVSIDLITGLADILDKLIGSLGTLGTVGFGAGIYSFIKNFSTLKTLATGVFTALTRSTDGSYDAFKKWSSASDAIVSSGKNLLKSVSAITGAIGVTIAVVGALYNSYKKTKEAAAEARQETIRASDEYLDAATSFEQAYIKYSGKTDLTADEEAELASAIDGTVNALGDKSSALQSVVNHSNDYLASLERIADEEIREAERVAKAKRDAAEKNLEEAAMGWEKWDGSEVDISLATNSEAHNIAKELNSKFLVAQTTTGEHGEKSDAYKLELSADADTEEIIEYYNFLLDYQEKLSDAGLADTSTYDKVTAAIGRMSESIGVYVDGTYEAVKANYQLSNGIPKTTEEFIAMREAILGDDNIKNLSFDTKMSMANTLDSEYGQLFDLSSAEAQARKFVGLINGYGSDEVNSVETFINLRTAVNNDEKPVGKYLSELDNIKNMTANWSEEEKDAFNTTFGIDSDSIKAQYDDVLNYISRIRNTPNGAYGEHAGFDIDSALHVFEQQEYEKQYQERIQELLNSLTASELAAVVGIKAEIDWENDSVEDIRKQIEEQAELNEAMSFTIAIDVEAEGINALNTALTESKSATGLATESIAALKARYEELDGYDAAALFEETANGIRINSTELSKLEEEYKRLNKQEIDKTLETLTGEYDKLTKEINDCTDASKLSDLYAERDTVLDKINDVASLASQYKGLTSAYNEWQSAQSAGQDRDMYESIISGKKDIEDEMSRGWLDDAAVEYLELLSGKELSTAGIDAQIAAYKELDNTIQGSKYSIWDFFTKDEDGNATSDGVYNFFEAVKAASDETAAYLKDGKYHLNFEGFEHNGKTGDAAIAEILGTSEELVQIMLKAAEDAGFVVNINGEYTDLANASDSINDLNEQLKNVGATEYTFNVNAKDLDYINEQIVEAQSALQYFENRDGKINLDDSDVRAAASILATLVYRKSDLENPTLMSIDVSQPTTKLEEVLGLAQQLKDAKANFEVQTEIGADTTEAQAEIDSLLEKLSSDGYADITAGLNIDATSVDTAIASINAISSEQMISLGLDTSKIDGYVADDKDATVTYEKDSKEVDEYDPPDFTRTVTFEVDSYAVDIYDPSNITRTVTYNVKTEGEVSEANGTANVNGTAGGRAFKQGDWGIKNSGTALGGELGTEVLVRNGKWYTIGDSGAEFFNYKKGDIIFNHKQTEELFANGRVTSGGGRGKSFAEGTAFRVGSIASGVGRNTVSRVIKEVDGSGHNGSVTVNNNNITINNNGSDATGGADPKSIKDAVKDIEKSASSSSSYSEEEFEETFDWIEVKISRLERAIDNLDKTASNVYKSWSARNSALAEEIGKVGEEIKLQEDAAQRYLKEANSVGLDADYVKKIQDGTIDIQDFEGKGDEALVEKIKDYQTWYEKYLACIDAAEDLRETESELYAQRFENVQTQYDAILQGYEHTEAMLNEYINQAEEQGYIVSRKYYDALIKNEKSNIAELQREQADLIAERDNAVEAGKIVEGSEAWYEQCAAIDEVTRAIEEANTSIIEYNNSIRDIDWQIFDIMQERISGVTAEADFLIELMSNKKLFDDDGKLTSQGLATMGLHTQNYNTHMYQADTYGEEVSKLNGQIAKDPYNQELINRRNELLELQRESILAAEGEKDAIRDMVEEGINLELDALQERIDLHNEELDSMKDLYDYQKRVEESSKNIASLRKQLSAYEGFDDEETRAKVQELKVSLEEAEADLKETEYDKYISDQQALLDTLYNEYELILNTRLDNVDYLLESVIDSINIASSAEGVIATALGSDGAISMAISNNATAIKETLTSESNKVGMTLSSAMNNIWSVGEGNAKSVLTMYGDDFKTKSATIITTLNGIKADIAAMVDDVDKDAKKKVDESKTQTSSVANPTKNNKVNDKQPKQPQKPANPEVTDDTIKGIAAAIWIYGKDSGWGNNPFRESKLTNKIGASNAKKVQDYVNMRGANGDLYDFWIKKGKNLDKYKYSAFKFGAKDIDATQLAWTQEGGKKEFIIRPSDGAILTPIAKGDSVLTSAASSNIWDMANSPAEFIKDNLGIGVTSVPNNSNVNNNYTQHFENVTFSMPNVHGYSELLAEMQKDKNFEKLILSMSIDRIAGKSSLAKGKSIR